MLYSRSFRRLRLKTQIYPEHTADHLRTRLDHTLEVAQIARHLARQLRLNEDLADAISLAHDVGHTPFGHSGERALHTFLGHWNETHNLGLDGFKHNWQGLRVVDKLEKSYPEHDGLNLTRAVRIGILNHTSLKYSERAGLPDWPENHCSCDMWDKLCFDPSDRRYSLFEVQTCHLADEIAQVIHDLEDAIISEAFGLEEIVRNRNEYPLLASCLDNIQSSVKQMLVEQSDNPLQHLESWTDWSRFPFADQDQSSKLVLRLRSEMIYVITIAVLDFSQGALDEWEQRHLVSSQEETQIEEFNNLVNGGVPFDDCVTFGSSETGRNFEELKTKLTDRVIRSERVNRMDGKADYVLRHILQVYLTSPKQVHQSVLDQYVKQAHPENADIRGWKRKELAQLQKDKDFVRAVVDYVSGMTDRFALQEYDQLYSAYPRIPS
ncbi:MAG: dNTP triphosphohydrolase [Planctomycetaceae bacterium]|nr:dNTP triphosphohydrolase [Planctomycetaceae bacterium]